MNQSASSKFNSDRVRKIWLRLGVVIILSCALMVAIQPFSVLAQVSQATATLTPTSDARADLLNRINNLRNSMNLPPYVLNEKLTQAANGHAQWMATTSRVEHTEPGLNGTLIHPADRALAVGYQSLWCCGENIYMGMSSQPDDAWDFWIHSQLHYANLITDRYTEIGIGIATAPNAYGSQTAFVLLFGMPANATPIPFTAHPVTAVPTLVPSPTLSAIAPLVESPTASALTPLPSLMPTATAVTPAQTSGTLEGMTSDNKPTPRFHVVQRGETLFRIALNYGVPLDRLAAANGIVDPARIYAGQVLVIP